MEKEMNQFLKKSIQRLPKKYREVFVLREYGELSYQEIAKTLRLNNGTVMSRLNRARRKIVVFFQEGYHERKKGNGKF
jgi:RNA polymerase sigma-70 factor (ECF subfamily)